MSYHTLFFFKQKTAYEMRISDWSSDVCSSDLAPPSPSSVSRAARRPNASMRDSPSPAPNSTPRKKRAPPNASSPSPRAPRRSPRDRKSDSWGESVSERVDHGGGSTIKKHKKTKRKKIIN